MAGARDDFSFHLRRAYLSMHRRANANFARYGLTADQYVVLTALANHGPLTQQEIARRCHSDPNTAHSIVGRLENKELLRREPHPTDGRALVVSLTAEGVALQRELFDFNETFQRELEGLFRPAELRSMIGFLGRITEAMSPDRLSENNAGPSS